MPDTAQRLNLFALQIGMVFRCRRGFFPNDTGHLGSGGMASGLFFRSSFVGSGDALPQGLAFGTGEVFVGLFLKSTLFTGAPVHPPSAGWGVQVNNVRACLAALFVRGAAAVQLAVRPDVFHQKSGSVQLFREGGQNVASHGRTSCIVRMLSLIHI